MASPSTQLECPAPRNVVRVVFSSVEDVRAALFFELADLPPRQRAALANRLTQRLRDAGHLARSVEQHYNAKQAAQLLSRSPEHVAQQAKAGAFGTVFRDDGGWLIPASGVQGWLAKRVFTGSVSEEGAT